MASKLEWRRKMIISGPRIEFREYMYSKRERYAKLAPEEEIEKEIIDEISEKERGEEPPKDSTAIYRAKSEFRRLIFSNAWAYKNNRNKRIPPLFLTLTFTDNIVDIKKANREFSKFIQRFNDFLFKSKKMQLKHVTVPQFQERGAVHYHCVFFNMPYIEKKVYTTIRKIWNRGKFIKLEKVYTAQGIFNYLSRYMMKDFLDGRLFSKKRYFSSRSLLRPLILRDDIAIEILMRQIIPQYTTLKHEGVYPSDYCGNIEFKNFELKFNVRLEDLELSPYVRKQLEDLVSNQKTIAL